MNPICQEFVQFVITDAPKYNKKLLEETISHKYNLIKDRKVYHNEYFAVRISYSKKMTSSFSNTILSLSSLEKYDKIPFFVVLVRQNADNLIFLANTTFLKKISHSSQELSMLNIRGSFNGSDIIREYNGIINSPTNFNYLFDIHKGLDWEDNLERLVEATSNIRPINQRFSPSESEKINILNSINRAIQFVESDDFVNLKNDLDERCKKCKNEILIASHIENTNIRGRLIESLITADDAERIKLIENLKELESSLPTYDTKNGLGDYYVKFDSCDTYTDIKTKVIYLNSNPKAYNIDKFLKQMSDTRSIFLFYFIGINEDSIFKTILCSVYHSKLIDSTIFQFHWAGRATRGVAQFSGSAIDGMLKESIFQNIIDNEKCILFLEKLLNL